MKHVLIVGASSAIAKEFSRQWAQKEQSHFSLVGRNAQSLENLAADLSVRSTGTTTSIHTGDLLSPQDVNRIMNQVCHHSVPDIVLIAQGMLPQQQACQQDLELLNYAVEVNATSQALFAESSARAMESNGGTIALISSVAGDRGRKSNYVYGASKAFINAFARGMQHRFAGTNLRIVLVKPGPVDTPMTAQLAQKPAGLASVEKVANDIIRGIGKNKLTVYSPRKWALIMLVVRLLPARLFNKTNL